MEQLGRRLGHGATEQADGEGDVGATVRGTVEEGAAQGLVALHSRLASRAPSPGTSSALPCSFVRNFDPAPKQR